MNADACPIRPGLMGRTTARDPGWLMASLLASLMALLLCACGGGGGTSDPAPVTITAQPTSVSATAGVAATFSVTASGDGISYQWQRSTDNAATWVNVPGATAATFVIASIDVTLSGYQVSRSTSQATSTSRTTTPTRFAS